MHDARTDVIRKLTAADLPAAQALTQALGWPHRAEDWAFMHSVGQGLAVDRAGALIGTAMSWRYGADGASMGLIAVAADAQGRGLGRRLTQGILDGLGDRRVILHATDAGRPLYASLGFVPGGVVRQHQGAAFGAGLIALEPGERLRPIGRSDPPVLSALDRAATGLARDAVLSALLAAASGVVLDRDGEAIGFALLRRFGRGHVIGPVVAPDASRARALIGHFLASRSGQFIRVDVPAEAGLSAWLEELGLPDAGPALRMERNPAPALHAVSTFALISQAFG